jgi:hypothetical protein
MNGLVTTADGWRGTARTVRWSPVLVTPLAASLALVVVHDVAAAGAGSIALLADTALALTAITAGFAVDDGIVDAARATPHDGRARLVARAMLVLPAVLVGWLVVLAVYRGIGAAGSLDVDRAALRAVGLAAAALGIAAVAGRVPSIGSPGTAAVGLVASAGVAARVVPQCWVAALPRGSLLSPVVVVLALATVATATKEPAR